MRFISLLLAICLLLTGCGAKSGSGNGNGPFKPTLDVTLDIKGQSVVVNVKTNMKISAEDYGAERKEGVGHIHMYLDNGEKIGVKTGSHTFTELPAGKHTVKVSLHNNDHTPYDVTKTYDFTIK
ncbi:hypothetical protein [Cohnella soli]|uniref:DUF4399 domain-containing protein n=1 Tax=Cohnella soli TaxID=425005 RepID=A0ABW0I4P0_9BACL